MRCLTDDAYNKDNNIISSNAFTTFVPGLSGGLKYPSQSLHPHLFGITAIINTLSTTCKSGYTW
ncbi:MAG: hypothetical protein ABIN67_22695 [Ferruginibacter sp.]